MTGIEFVGAFAIVVVACLVQSSVGFGSNLIAMPTIVLFAPELVPTSVLVAVVVMNVLVLVRDRQSVEVGSVGGAIVGRVIGTGIGVWTLARLSEDGLSLVIALGVLAMVAIVAVGVAPRRTLPTMLGAGTISGFTASTSGIGGPPVALLFQDAEGAKVRGSMGGFFVLGSPITLTGLYLAGKFGADELRWGLSLIPAAIIGFALSGPALPIVDRGWTRPAILTLSAVSAVVLLIRLAVG